MPSLLETVSKTATHLFRRAAMGRIPKNLVQKAAEFKKVPRH